MQLSMLVRVKYTPHVGQKKVSNSKRTTYENL